MSNHVSEWLSAYLDGELYGSRLQYVEAHLPGCEACQAELESLESLSGLLREVPEADFSLPERFATQVNLRTPHKQARISRKQVNEVGWWAIPVGLLASWIFISTAFALGDILSAASDFGVVTGVSDWLGSGSSNSVYLSTTIGQLGLLSGNSLNWAEVTETFTRTSLPQAILQVSIALLYLGWLAIWWTRQTRQRPGQLLEG
jgi:predicted anti-sigma-YlaC factor YlaD